MAEMCLTEDMSSVPGTMELQLQRDLTSGPHGSWHSCVHSSHIYIIENVLNL